MELPEHGFQIRQRGGAVAALQIGQRTGHLQRRIDHHAHFGKGRQQRVPDGVALGGQRRLLFPGRGLQADQVDEHQCQHRPACGAPARCAQQLRGQRGELFAGAGAARVEQLELRQIPVRLARCQPAFGGSLYADGALEAVFCQRGDAGFGQQFGVFGPGEQGGTAGRQRQHGHAARASEQQPGVVGIAHRLQRSRGRGAGRRGRQLRHDAGGGASGLLQRGKPSAEPSPVAGGDPDRLPGTRLRLDGEMQLGRVVKQLLFEQAVKHAAQPGGAGFERALG